MPLVRIDVNQGRSPEQLRGLSRGIHAAIMDWSFGFGRAQYVTGELGVPGR
ncbi:tautomerase family protein [Arthrobacter sp. ok362]|uniref:tautomerase family protein n=1 Tax=Arthrobacter sp. ok362 TaxID=1761745 RepID=UPI00087ECF87|nr:tautomerase family protein [Arthrobacter sp. ok362]SDL71616.1 Tautomerase enzyme [Arthrobacter sp. ok362]